MSITIDCGEGKHSVCSGYGTHHYLVPQLNDGKEFECACPCHKQQSKREDRRYRHTTNKRDRHRQ